MALPSYRRKLNRADAHLHSFKSKLSAWEDEHPYRIVDDRELYPGWHTMRVYRGSKPLPTDLSLYLGDFLQNARAALDHFCWDLIAYHGGEPGDKTEFPIFASKTKYDDWLAHKARRGEFDVLPPQIRAGIDACQPHERWGQAAHADPLEVLRVLTNIDKHRFVQGTYAWLYDPEPISRPFVLPPNTQMVEMEDFAVDRNVWLKDGDPVFALRLEPPAMEEEVQTDKRLTPQVTFSDDQPITLDSLFAIRREIDGLFASFEPFGTAIPPVGDAAKRLDRDWFALLVTPRTL